MGDLFKNMGPIWQLAGIILAASCAANMVLATPRSRLVMFCFLAFPLFLLVTFTPEFRKLTGYDREQAKQGEGDKGREVIHTGTRFLDGPPGREF